MQTGMTLPYATSERGAAWRLPTDAQSWRTAFLLGWPPLALGYAYFLAVFEGFWGDPWYEFAWSSDLKGTVFYLIGGPLACATCAAWWAVALGEGARRPWIWPGRRAALTAIACLLGVPLMLMAMLLLNDVMRSFFRQAFRY